jgi:hypothetical protein
MLILILCYKFYLKKAIKYLEEQNDEIGSVIIYLFNFALWAAIFITLLLGGQGAFTQIVNPEYSAFNQIINTIK